MTLFGIGLLGGFCLQFISLYKKYGQEPEDVFKKLLKSPVYWVFSIGMILVSGIVAWVLYSDAVQTSKIAVFTSGVAARSILEGVISGVVQNSSTVAGDSKLRSFLS